WMDYMLPNYLLNSPDYSGDIQEVWTLAIGLFSMISGQDKANYTTFAAGALIVALPITLLYMAFQRFLIQGITAGATKG
ncbi:MAG TPA: sugar ABC transporter permease, partial [Bacilli bacterium]|nr:sugar ABC transporter permease [Bacilli bacterium]